MLTRKALLAAPALVLSGVTLLFAAGNGMHSFVTRASKPNAGVRAETGGHSVTGKSALEQLHCIDETVVSLTHAGDAVRLQTGGDGYLQQRVAELIFPRVNITSDPLAPMLSVLPRPASAGGKGCAGVEITLRPGS